ncbi:hypothetical protein MG293_015027, partial [Ovis ammon polii]
MARAGSSSGDAAAGERAGGAGRSEPWELSLEEVLKAYEQPINEEQAWAVCFQCCRGLRGAPGGRRRIRDTADILLRRDGSVSARRESGAAGEAGDGQGPVPQVVQSLGFAIYRALDWGLAEHEERELSPQLERLIDLMANSDCDDDGGGGTADEGYGGPEEEEEAEGGPRTVRTFAQAMRLCAARLTEPRGAQTHYQAVCRALFVETLELRAFLARVREAKEVRQASGPGWRAKDLPGARLWVQLMRELRHGVKLKKVQEQEFNPLPTEFQLTPFEMLMQDIRARNYKLRKVMVDGDIPPRVKKDAHELILDFIRSRPPLKQVPAPRGIPKLGSGTLPARARRASRELAPHLVLLNPLQVSERRLRPLPQKQRTLHEKILEEIKQERRLRPVESRRWDGRGERGFGSLPCILNACSGDVKSTSCINLSVTDVGSSAQRPRPRVLLKAPTLAEMEEMNTSEEEESPCGEGTLKRDRSFSEHDLAQLRSEVTSGLQPVPQPPGGLELSRPRAGSMQSWRPSPLEPGTWPLPPWTPSCSHPVESLALTVEEVMDVRRVLVKAEMEKFLQNKELFSSLKKGKICCCCRAKFPLLSWPPSCLFCKRCLECLSVLQMKMPSKKFSHIPVYTLGFESPQRMSTAKTTPTQRRDAFQCVLPLVISLQGLQWRNVEEEFPHMYTHGCVMKDVCSDCTGFVADVVHSSRRSVDALNTTPRRARQTQSLYVPNTWTLDL